MLWLAAVGVRACCSTQSAAAGVGTCCSWCWGLLQLFLRLAVVGVGVMLQYGNDAGPCRSTAMTLGPRAVLVHIPHDPECSTNHYTNTVRSRTLRMLSRQL